MQKTSKKALKIISKKGGIIRTREALEYGIHPRTLYSLRDQGDLEIISRGLYKLSSLPPVGDPDLELVAGRIPQGIVCLISALAIHELTTQIPHEVHLAIPRTARYPVCHEVPIKIYRFSDLAYKSGIIQKEIDGFKVKVYDSEKTLADTFKYRNKIGLDVFLEALNNYQRRKDSSLQKVLEYAKIDRVSKQIRPYLEATT
ncbi:hypothetical protein Pla110_23670 [Polystyrenella longa]|uniref:AbiEi antitoxin N-terminal domain-containing protein n=1 Tax=Polystyrenella longa TaxID=2528007 RepID=A0A518CN25_9PLAN|nr:type IV toxin-antitoxin system AbiEi family antitoxin domain-containing protein [Polystyrenella longa]QDU80636.1 hypothetical protein Pla110_23670 [Polystyrenella longa]